jgi:hypothetical protein
MTRTSDDRIADAIDRSLISPNIWGSNGEPANIVDALHELARAVRNLGGIADALGDLAAAVREHNKKSPGGCG